MYRGILLVMILGIAGYLFWPKQKPQRATASQPPALHFMNEKPETLVEGLPVKKLKDLKKPLHQEKEETLTSASVQEDPETRYDRIAKSYANPENIKKLFDQEASMEFPELHEDELTSHEEFGDAEINRYELKDGSSVETASNGVYSSEMITDKDGDTQFQRVLRDGHLRSFVVRDGPLITHTVYLDERGQVESLLSTAGDDTIMQEFSNGKPVKRRLHVNKEPNGEVYEF